VELKDKGWDTLTWIPLAQNWTADCRCEHVDELLGFKRLRGNSWLAEELSAFLSWRLLHEVFLTGRSPDLRYTSSALKPNTDIQLMLNLSNSRLFGE
jgi:hypothetical protein